MKSIIVIATLGSILTLASCKSAIIVPEPESQPDFFSTAPYFVKAFLKASRMSPNIIKSGDILIGNPLNGAVISSVKKAYSSEVLEWSAQHGYYSILKKVVERARKHNLAVSNGDLSEAVYLATQSYHDADKKIVYLIEQGANINSALYFAGKHGNLDGISYLFEKGAKDLDQAVIGASHGGEMEIVLDIVKMGANPNVGMKEAIGMGYKDLNTVQQLVELGADDFDEGLRIAAIYGHNDIAEYMVDEGATDFNTALHFATGEVYDKPNAAELVKYLLGRGATNIEETLEKVTSNLRTNAEDSTPQGTANRTGWIKIQQILTRALDNTP